MHKNVEDYIKMRGLNREYIHEKCTATNNSIVIPLYTLDQGITGGQERYIDPENHDGVKSKTCIGSKGFRFLNLPRDKDKDILITEGEIDFLSIIGKTDKYNIMGLKGVSNLPAAIKDIEKLKKRYNIYILVDNDEPANKSIERIAYTELILYDMRGAIQGAKDLNDAILQNKLNLNAMPRVIIKHKPERKVYTRGDMLDTLDKINSIPAIDILETLFPQYTRRGPESILENGKETHGYKYSKKLNVVSDFSGKGRPSGTTFNIAKARFNDAHLTFLYFKGKI